MVDFEVFRAELGRGGRPPYDAVLMFRILVLQALYTLSDDQAEYQLRDRLSFVRFVGLALHQPVPDAKTIWLVREQLTRASKARAPQIDRDGRWTIRRGRKPKPPEGGAARQAAGEIAVPMFGYKNHVGIDCRHRFIRRFTVTHAARHDGSQLGAVLDPNNTASGVWADTAYRSKANLALLRRRGLTPHLRRAKPQAKPLPAHIARGNTTRSRVRAHVEQVFATEKRRMGLVIRCIGLVRAAARITLANLAYNMRRLAWLDGKAAAA